jgi:hypothetical protein
MSEAVNVHCDETCYLEHDAQPMMGPAAAGDAKAVTP